MNATRRRRAAVHRFLDGLMTDDVKEAVWLEGHASYMNVLLYGFDAEYEERIRRLSALALRTTSALPKGDEGG